MKCLSLTIVYLLISWYAFSQCPPNGITTNPSAPFNPQLPAATNLYFDWRQASYQNNTTCQPFTQVESPFYKIDNLEILRQSKDMLPEDGWELIRREFGYDNQNNARPDVPEHTYYVLYNKVTGILRILLKTCRAADYNGAKITIKFDATSSFQTSLFDHTSRLRAMDEAFTRNPAAQSVSVFVNDRTKWFYADFPMAYDPCTCMYQSKINIISQLIENSQIELSGSITGTITSISNKQGSVNSSGSYSFKDFLNDADKYKKVYGGVDAFINETKNVAQTIPNNTDIINALNLFQTGLKDNQFLKTGLAAVPWLKAAVGVLDFFSGGGKTQPQQVQIMPMAVNLSVKLSGTISTSNQYHDIKFTTPGSLNAQNDPAIYPFYNEVMGVFNLMKGPKMQWRRNIQGGRFCCTQFRLKEPMKWVFNTASDLQIQDAKVAYVMLFNDNSANPPASMAAGFSYLEGKDTSGMWEYRTEYVDFNCLGQPTFLFFMINNPYNTWPYMLVAPRVYMKVMLNLSRVSNPNAQNVLLVLKFPITMEETSTPLDGGGFDPNQCVGGWLSQATSTEVNTFCTSTAYTNNRLSRVMVTPLDTTANNTNRAFTFIAPNPVANRIFIKGDVGNTAITSIELFNAQGSRVYLQRITLRGTVNYAISSAQFPAGIYFVKVGYSDKVIETKKIVIAR
jgi:hypothetical protein